MDTKDFNQLLLKTAFSCMACDGDIDSREIDLIKKLQKEDKKFGDINTEIELNKLLEDINKNGKLFIKRYFHDLNTFNLTEENELNVIEVAIETIKADDKVEYAEIKFFKVIRSKLKIKNETILDKHPDFEDYLEQDIISDAYLFNLQEDFLNANQSLKFDPLIFKPKENEDVE